MTLAPVAIAKANDGYVTNIDKTTVENTDFRRVLFTGPHSQLVVMSLKPGDEIGKEIHKNVDQFFRVEQGRAVLEMNGKSYDVEKDFAFIVPAGVEHNVKNVGSKDLKLYTIYSPPQHPPTRIQHTKTNIREANNKHEEMTR